MIGTLRARLAWAIAAALITVVASPTPSFAAGNIGPPAPPDQTIDLPAGVACSGFDLEIGIWADPHRVFKEFKDKNNNVVRILMAGAGNTLGFTNLSTSKMLLVKTGGSVEHVTLNLDGSQTWTVTGHNVVIFFPTDSPPGPSTVLYVGKLVFTISPLGVSTVQSFKGTSTDICAALSA